MSFLQKALDDNVCHVDVLLRLGDVQVTLGILSQCFAQKPSYLLHYFPPVSGFWDQFATFDYALL
jgi:hypothetical protein